MNNPGKQTDRRQCIRCGTCCRKGGPSLHTDDLSLLKDGRISHSDLFTIRQGESAYSPISGKVEPVKQELVKLAGKGKTWTCSFLNETGPESQCELYVYRPLECRLLKCWDPQETLDVIGRETISRKDILNPEDPVLDIITLHDKECSFLEIEKLLTALADNRGNPDIMAQLTDIVRKDLAIRSHTVSRFDLPVTVEFFILGRPLFTQLKQKGIETRDINGDVQLIVSRV